VHRLLIQSDQMKAVADRILRESGIIDVLKEYGEVKIGGSYALDVMLRPDIDLFVITPEHDWEKVTSVYSKIMARRYFREFDFVNWVDFDGEGVVSMRGYYFQPWVPIDGRLWKMDIWLITADQDRSDSLTNHFKELLGREPDESKRIAILEIKKAMLEGKKYRNGVNGRLIYEAVLEGAVKSVEDFEKYLYGRASENLN
jgi:hypothetical protein